MPENFDQVAARFSEDKEIAGMRISPQRFLDLESQPIAAPSKRQRRRDAWRRRRRSQALSSTLTSARQGGTHPRMPVKGGARKNVRRPACGEVL